MKKTILKASVAAVLAASVPTAEAAVNTFNYNGFFTMLATDGAAMANTSITGRTVNQFQSPISGTLSFDTATGAGIGTLTPFAFFGSTDLANAVGIKMQSVGDGAGGPGTLVAGNMLFDWGGTTGIPVSIVLDAQGFFAGDLDGTGGLGAIAASDGTFVGATVPQTTGGYLDLGPSPIVTTAFNTLNINGCDGVTPDCMNNGSSGGIPVGGYVADATANPNDFDMTTPTAYDLAGEGVGGSPFQDGPFVNNNANFNITSLTFASSADATIAQNCTFVLGDTCAVTPNAVPVPAAVWLFGSGLLGLVGVARRKKSEV